MSKTKSRNALPLRAKLAMKRLGTGIATARKMRGVTMALMSERAMLSRTTLARVERGDPSVAFGTYASVLFVLGLTDAIGELLRDDAVTKAQLDERIPKRVRGARLQQRLALGT